MLQIKFFFLIIDVIYNEMDFWIWCYTNDI